MGLFYALPSYWHMYDISEQSFEEVFTHTFITYFREGSLPENQKLGKPEILSVATLISRERMKTKFPTLKGFPLKWKEEDVNG